jgi:hypothetical protein
MPWNFTDLKYGWKIAAGITFAAVTIFVADNLRRRINQVDEIELDLAIAERCLVTQYGTNALGEPLYYVSPPEYVRSWYSNNYETQVVAGVTSVFAVVYTNIYTNAAGYRTDKSKAIARAATIKSLVPFFCDTNTVYDGTTNIVMLTVTGLWSKLQIGDGTNQFTSVPCWTNHPGETNEVIYPAVYGPPSERIYSQTLVEMYKVLNALSCTFPQGEWWYPVGLPNYQEENGDIKATWAEAKISCDELSWSPSRNLFPVYCYAGGVSLYRADKHLIAVYGRITGLNTAIICNATFYFKAGTNATGVYTPEFYDFGLDFLPNRYSAIESFNDNVDSEIISTVLLGPTPSQAAWIAMPWCSEPINSGGFKGFSFDAQGWFLQWNFQYCTNKYW